MVDFPGDLYMRMDADGIDDGFDYSGTSSLADVCAFGSRTGALAMHTML